MAVPAPADRAPLPFHAMGQRVWLGNISLHLREVGSGGQVPLLLLHGFPEQGGSWRRIVAALRNDRRCVIPDLRGYGHSDAPAALDSYRIDRLIEDIIALADYVAPNAPVDLVGHDWGGVLAWWVAARHPARVRRLVVANAPHPVALQEALSEDPVQRAASAYIRRLQRPGAEAHFMAEGAAAAWAAGFGQQRWFDEEDRDGFVSAWSRPGAAAAMIAWYRASPFIVPAGNEPTGLPLWAQDAGLTVTTPTLLIWGINDDVLLPTLLPRCAAHATNLETVPLAAHGHGVIHEAPGLVAKLIEGFTR